MRCALHALCTVNEVCYLNRLWALPIFLRARPPRFHLVRLDSTSLAAFLAGTVLTTLLLAAQSGGKPLHEAEWILIGAVLSMLTRGYGLFVSGHEAEGGGRYLTGLARTTARGWPVVAACLPTVLLLLLAALFGWPDDHENPDGSVVIGYTTFGLNLNVLLLFFWGVVSARRAGISRGWTVVLGIANAALGLLIVTVNIQLAH
jgi:hypothetical protein